MIFKITRTKEYILLVNSYGRVRKVFKTGGYTDIHNGGNITR